MKKLILSLFTIFLIGLVNNAYAFKFANTNNIRSHTIDGKIIKIPGVYGYSFYSDYEGILKEAKEEYKLIFGNLDQPVMLIEGLVSLDGSSGMVISYNNVGTQRHLIDKPFKDNKLIDFSRQIFEKDKLSPSQNFVVLMTFGESIKNNKSVKNMLLRHKKMILDNLSRGLDDNSINFLSENDINNIEKYYKNNDWLSISDFDNNCIFMLSNQAMCYLNGIVYRMTYNIDYPNYNKLLQFLSLKEYAKSFVDLNKK
jgi:hypothetical protein